MAEEETKAQVEGEPMQLEGAAEAPAEVQPEAQVDIDQLVATLDKIGVKDPQHLEGLHRTAQQHGPMANELGELRDEVARLRQAAQQPPQQRAPHDPYADPYDQPQGQPVDLRQEMRSAMREFYQDEVIKPQQQASQAYWRDVETVQSSEYYPVVQEEFQNHMSNPAVQRSLAQGSTTHTNEFHKVVAGKFKDIAQQLKTTAAALKEQAPPGAQPPHIESGQQPPERTPEGEQAKRQALLDLDKASKGTDDDLDAMLKALIPDDDPILRE